MLAKEDQREWSPRRPLTFQAFSWKLLGGRYLPKQIIFTLYSVSKSNLIRSSFLSSPIKAHAIDQFLSKTPAQPEGKVPFPQGAAYVNYVQK